MAVTENEIETVRFSKPPIGKRGYNEDEVDAFLDMVAADVAQYRRDLEEARSQNNFRLVSPEIPQPPQQAPLPPAPPPPAAPEPPSAQAARILELAERTADQVAREAEELSTRAIREAKDKAAETMAEARYEASKLVDAARAEATEIEERLAALRVFETKYRERLDTYIDSQLHALRADSRVEPAS